jgi:carbonic anhydrase/acetyltransferase-like protein (isoleucine patch superfamily)
MPKPEFIENCAAEPDVKAAAFVAESAILTGKIVLRTDSSVWHNAVARGDLAPVFLGERSNIQDGVILHVAENLPCVIGDDVTVGHGAIIHACKVGNRCLVGMGSIILNGAEIGDECIIGAGALVTGGKKIPSRSLVMGNPGRVIRNVRDDEVENILDSAKTYVDLAKDAKTRQRLA